MRIVNWLFVVSVALFVTGVGFVIASGRSRAPESVAADAPPLEAVGSTRQIMAAITGPSATVVYNAVGTIVNLEGTKEIEPQNDEEWAAVANSAAALVESGNLLLIGNRVLDNGDWVTLARTMMETGTLALKAAEAHDKDGILDAGAKINETCDNCHAKYQRQ